MATPLTKPCSRRVSIPGVGAFVVTLTDTGVCIRGFGKRKVVAATYEQVAFYGLQAARANLTAEEWAKPLTTLAGLGANRAAKTTMRSTTCATNRTSA